MSPETLRVITWHGVPVFRIDDDPRPGLVEGTCLVCGWQPFTAAPEHSIALDLAEHVMAEHPPTVEALS